MLINPLAKSYFNTNLSYSVQPQYKNCTICFEGVKQPKIDVSKETRKLLKNIRKMGIKPIISVDVSKKILLMMQTISECLTKIKNSGLQIPKFSLYLDNSSDFGKGIAAVTDVFNIGRKTFIEQQFKPGFYRKSKGNNELFRLKECPDDTTLKIDFYHEFAHAYQGSLNRAFYEKLGTETFSDEINKEISEKLTAYATVNKAEFVAEYYAYRMTGHSIKSDKLKELYEQCRGPIIT